MSDPNSQNKTTESGPAPWLAKLPDVLFIGGGLVCVLGFFMARQQFAFSYLLGFMMLLSICLGGLFLVIIHHLFDASWSVPTRRICEHLACLAPWLGLFFLPVLVLSQLDLGGTLPSEEEPRTRLYAWMAANPDTDHSLHVKKALFNVPMFMIVSVGLFAIWTWLSYSLRRASLQQDETGDPQCTGRMRKLAAGGIFIFAFSLTMGAIFWMKGLEHQWFSTMYGVYYFAETVWITLATLYLIVMLGVRWGPLKPVVGRNQFHSIAILLFAFTVFYAYIHFSQYFLIWNASIPEETFWYVYRDQGSWRSIGYILIFGHFFIPFLTLLRIDAKLNPSVMVPVIGMIWALHYFDISFNITPVLHREGFSMHILDFASLAFIGGFLAKRFSKDFRSHPPYPQRDPRIAEAMGVYVEPLSEHTATGGAK